MFLKADNYLITHDGSRLKARLPYSCLAVALMRFLSIGFVRLPHQHSAKQLEGISKLTKRDGSLRKTKSCRELYMQNLVRMKN